MVTVQRVTDILQAKFQHMSVDLEKLPGGRVAGSVAWAGFAEYDHVDRQTMIRSELREKLGADAQQVGVLLAYTPDELEAMSAA